MDLAAFTLYNPVTGSPKEIPIGAGNYFVVLKEGCSLPDVGIPVKMAKFRGMDIIYTGVAGASSGLRKRITWAHLGDNAGRSTLRLSLGVLMGFKPIPRDASNPNNGHTRFRPDEEARLTDWMKDNLLVYFFSNDDFEAVEEELIASLNPPLNLMKNYNPVNRELRTQISYLRSQVQFSELEQTFSRKKKLLSRLSAPESFVKGLEHEFEELARSLMNDFHIKKGDKRYWMTDIEFYLFHDKHRDIITYPRRCEAGMWFFHASGVDISFKSWVDFRPHTKKQIEMPYLTKGAVFGGILIRGIEPVGKAGQKANGPLKVCDELFDQINAFHTPKDFPKIVEAPSSRGVSVNPTSREGVNPDAEKKVHDILSYNYSGYDTEVFSESELVKEYERFHEDVCYRFTAKQPSSK